MKRVLVVWTLSAFALSWGQSNANKGQIQGTVYDQKQAVIPGASIKAVNVDTGLTRETKTNDAGQYQVVLLDPAVMT